MMLVSLGIGALVAISLIVVVSALTGKPVTLGKSQQPTSALVGTKVAAFSVPGVNRGTVSAPWKSGHAGAVMFFASWCTPCRNELPTVAAYLQKHSYGSVQVIGIDAEGSQSGLPSGKAFVASSHVLFPVGFDPTDSVVTGIFKFGQLPETVFVSKSGIVKNVVFGAITPRYLNSELKKLQHA
jgi:cytochrome c biogenesis protein CcmG, thiol:disulfide interchange protein DsbE